MNPDIMNSLSPTNTPIHDLRPKSQLGSSTGPRKKIRILSLDGGGLKGIIPATMLTYVEQQLQHKTGDDSVRLADYFDFIAGTSTGGILACIYLTPDPKRPNRPKMAAEEALDLYMSHGKRIFGRSFKQKWKSLFGFVRNKLSSEGLDASLQETFGAQTWLKNFVKPCLITAYDLAKEVPFLFTSASAKNRKEKNFRIWEVARATSAAPSVFQPAKIQSEGGDSHTMMDGCVITNNPAICAMTEVQKMDFAAEKGWGRSQVPGVEDMMIVSLGTGQTACPQDKQHLQGKGLLGWLKPILMVRMAGNSDMIDYQLSQLFQVQSSSSSQNYFRIEPELYDADESMDNAAPENLALLHQAGLKNIDAHRQVLDQIVDQLIANHVDAASGTETLEQERRMVG